MKKLLLVAAVLFAGLLFVQLAQASDYCRSPYAVRHYYHDGYGVYYRTHYVRPHYNHYRPYYHSYSRPYYRPYYGGCRY